MWTKRLKALAAVFTLCMAIANAIVMFVEAWQRLFPPTTEGGNTEE